MPVSKKKNKNKKKLNKSKWLYDFDVVKETTEKVEEKSTDENGNEVTITREVDVSKNVKCYILRPSRKLLEGAELFYGVEMAN